MTWTRRDFLIRGAQAGGALSAAALLGLGLPGRANAEGRYGPLVPDPAGKIDLPKGFSYTELSPIGAPMSDGLLVPGSHDGMAAFPGPKGQVILIRNHEQELRGQGAFGKGNTRLTAAIRDRLYDPRWPCLGGTTTLIYDPAQKAVTKSWLSLGGTARNCCGGPTPWGSWLTCEESEAKRGEGFQEDHGFVFEVPATTQPGLADPVPLVAMGRFYHEGVAVDAATGILYLTEDRRDGLFYRFLPTTKGKLREGGRLQALTLLDLPGAPTHNWKEKKIPTGKRLRAGWLDITNVKSPKDDLRAQGASKGATVFTRGEGIFPGNGGIYFACTDGGRRHTGQVWHYRPGEAEASAKPGEPAGTLELVVEPNDPAVLDNVDNITLSPWGDVVGCEDGRNGNAVIGITPKGEIYPIAWNRGSPSEFAGATFSPDGATLFVNVQWPGVTLAITGPWQGVSGPSPR